jgi:hypothetical protein
MFGGDQAKAKQYTATLEKYMEALTGDFVMAATDLGGQGLTLAALMGVKDQDKAREAQREVAAVYQDPAAAEYYKKMGVEMSLQKDAYKVGDVSVDIIQTKLAQLPPEAAPMAAMLSNFLTQHLAIGKDTAVIAYGADARQTVEALLGGAKGGLDQDKGVQRAVKNMAAHTWALMYVNAIDLARELKLGGMNPLAAMLAGVDAETGLAISFGATDGSAEMVFDVPLETVQKAYQAFQKTKGSL